MRIGPLEVTFHRTVRVADGRTPSNLPPSLGRMKLYKVSKYRDNCPKDWDEDAAFMSLHDTEAMWMSFHGGPVAVIVGAGGVNALTGAKLGTVLEKDNYIVTPPQPWLDGWKSPDGTVYQFVATPHKKGDGLSVGEQLIGAESKTGAIGIAVFDPSKPLAPKYTPSEGYTKTAWGGAETMEWSHVATKSLTKGGIIGSSQPMMMSCLDSSAITRAARPVTVTEMGIGKGGKIIQSVYPDPHGLDVWNAKATAIAAFYLVDAKTAEEITGEKVAAPSVHDGYTGPWFGLDDNTLGDVAGSPAFATLKPAISAAFPGDTTNAEEETKAEHAAPTGA